MVASPDLRGRTVGVTADRRGRDQAVMFGRLGAEVVLGPTIAKVRIPDPGLLRRRTEEISADPPDFVIANTGTGMRTWAEAADEWGLGDGFRRALGRAEIVSRGPKATGALSSMGLAPGWRSPTEQLDEVVDHLRSAGVAGKRVAFQLHGDDGSAVVEALREAGAEVVTIPVYVWQRPPRPEAALDLIERTCDGKIDAMTFTAGPQIEGLFDLAGERRREPLLAALNDGSVVVGCIGPVCARAAAGAGIAGAVVPSSWRLGSLVKAVAEALTRD